ncbi:MAG: PilW family protein [Burkholderiaceae bacterium]
MKTTAVSSTRGAPRLSRQRAQAGFTLIEMMIAVTIGLGMLAGLVGVLATSSSNSRSNDRTAELMTNGRYALDSMKDELREAGFRGYTADPGLSAPGAMVVGNECLQAGATAGSFVSNVRQGVWGANDPGADPFGGTCIPAGDFAAGNDIVAVRRAAAIPAAALAAGTVYLQSTYGQGQVFAGVAAPAFSGAPAPLASFPVRAYVYYIRPWSISAAEVPQVPALVRVSLNAGGAMASELVASGIEHMELRYGRLATDLSTQYLDAGAGPLNATSFDSSATPWEEVNSVRIWLLARNVTPEPGYQNTQTYTMGDQSYTVNDGFRRQMFTTVVQLRN